MFSAKNIKRILLLSMVFLLAAAFSFNLIGNSTRAEASGISSLQQEYDRLEEERRRLADEIVKAQENQEKEKEAQEALQEQLRVIEGQVNNLLDQIAAIEESISVKEVEIVDKQEEVDETYELFKRRLRAMYIEGNVSSLELLFSSEGLSEFLTNVEYAKRISQHDNDLINQLIREKQELQDLKDGLDKDKADLVSAKSDLSLKQEELGAAYEESVAKLSALEETEAFLEEQQDLTSEQQAKVDAEIQRAIEEAAKKAKNQSGSSNGGGSTNYVGGEFIWPVPGYSYISSPFGMRTHPITGIKKLHKGIDISGGGIYGANIVASNSGTVIKVGWDSGGYGNYIMVDHGGGKVTLYAHCSKIEASYGQNVQQGQVIAKVGSTGLSSGPHLHFEVRINGTATNPLQYVSAN